jgi:hypothetical protein
MVNTVMVMVMMMMVNTVISSPEVLMKIPAIVITDPDSGMSQTCLAHLEEPCTYRVLVAAPLLPALKVAPLIGHEQVRLPGQHSPSRPLERAA